MINVITIIIAKAGNRVELLEAFAQIAPFVHAEKGCIEYQPVIDANDAGDMQTITPF